MATKKLLISVKDCPCDGCKAKPCGHPAHCVKFSLWLNKTVDAVEAEKYDELRENFIDYVCSGIPNVAPYCANRCRECVDGRGWCKEDPATCKGFNPALERKDND